MNESKGPTRKAPARKPTRRKASAATPSSQPEPQAEPRRGPDYDLTELVLADAAARRAGIN